MNRDEQMRHAYRMRKKKEETADHEASERNLVNKWGFRFGQERAKSVWAAHYKRRKGQQDTRLQG